MSDDISVLLQRIREGRDEEASRKLWEAYFEKMTAVARRNLGSLPKRVADEEDVAASAMHSFFKAAEGGRLQDLQNRDELWKLLITIVIRKANRHKERATALKRGGGIVRGESVFAAPDSGKSAGLAGFPDEAFFSDLSSECSHLLSLLDDDTLRRIALLKLEGYTTDEIAAEMNVARSTVKRKLDRIREQWKDCDSND
ncbi:MAG: ECF-type sigma factor [Planctomycetaceae bacterium]